MLRSNGAFTRFLRRAPQVLLGLVRRGAAWLVAWSKTALAVLKGNS